MHPIPPEVLEKVRVSGVDEAGIPVEHVTASGGEPVRCCLRDVPAGEELILFGYRPPLPDSPYREVGAVYAHARACAGPGSVTGYPPEWRGGPQVLRAYDRRGWIHDARVHDGTDPEAEIAALLALPEVERIHSRNVAHGCYMVAITRR